MYGQDILCKISQVPLKFHTKYLTHTLKEVTSGTRPTYVISIELEIRPKFGGIWCKTWSTDHNIILHMPRHCNCRDVCKISLWSID